MTTVYPERHLATLSEKLLLPPNLGAIAASYRAAKPYPHVVIDNLFPNEMLDSVLDEMAEMRAAQWVNVDQNPRERTVRMRSAAEMHAAGDRIVGLLHSASFLYFLSDITGIEQLLPDPYLQGAGFAVMRSGDYFDVHADRNVAYETGLQRRLAMIIFLNKDWKKEYHGELQLWTPDGKRCETMIEPVYNRTILFEVAYPNFHGVPEPLACPPHRVRQSFIAYFHTAGKAEANAKPHTTIFAPRMYGTPRQRVRSVIREIVPPVVMRLYRRMFK